MAWGWEALASPKVSTAIVAPMQKVQNIPAIHWQRFIGFNPLVYVAPPFSRITSAPVLYLTQLWQSTLLLTRMQLSIFTTARRMSDFGVKADMSFCIANAGTTKRATLCRKEATMLKRSYEMSLH